MIWLIIVVIGAILLQIFLSKGESKWPGLILPIITFLFSLVALANVMDTGESIDLYILLLTVFLMYNIPTAVLLGIYFVCRKKIKKPSELDKMNIQDLD